jgi:hypothetical protein
VLVAVVCGAALSSSQIGAGAEPARSVVGVTLQSVFTSTQAIPASWVETLIFAKDPSTIEFFERPRLRLTNEQKHVVELRSSDFPTLKMWLLYRFDGSAAEHARSADPDRRRLYETHKDATWLFVLPVAPNLNEILINGTNLTYTLTGSGARRSVAGTAFRAPLPRYGGSRKGAQGYVRIDHLPQINFVEAATELNRALPETLRLDPGNSGIWPGDAALHVAPETLGGRRYVGPEAYDRMAVERGYTPVFIVLSNLTDDVILRREKPWVAVESARGELLTDLAHQDPELWTRLSPQVQARYRAPARLAAGREARLVALWKRDRDSDAPPRFFVLFIQRPGGQDFRAVLFRLLAASAR